MKHHSYYFFVTLMGVSFLASIGFSEKSFAGQHHERMSAQYQHDMRLATDIPEASDPDACKGSQERKECKRWYYLSEARSPDAWLYTQRNHHEKQKRWYKVVLAEQSELKPSRVISLEDVHFNYDKAELRPDALPILAKDVVDLKSSKVVKVKIVGHTDAKGSEEYNEKLSEQRAEAVRQYLVHNGVQSNRLTTEGKGERDPIASNTTPDGKDNPQGRAQNRRVEIHIWDAYAKRD